MMHHDTPLSQKHPADLSEAPSILVVGTGAVGGYYGARLARAGAVVSTVHRSDFDTVKQHGIWIDSIDGGWHFRPHQVLRHVSECQQPPDYLLVTLKSLPELNLPQIIRPAVGPETVIVLLQNGIEIEEPVARAFPDHEIISALAFICVQRTSPGHIQHLCFGRITIGRYPGGISASVHRLAKLFQADQMPYHITDAPVTARWAKLLWNAPFNPISVLTGHATTKEIMASPECVELVRNVMKEAFEIAAALGHPLPENAIEENLQATRRMLPYHTSMSQDFTHGRPLETEAILGAAIRAGVRTGIKTPYMEGLYALLTLLDKQRKLI